MSTKQTKAPVATKEAAPKKERIKVLAVKNKLEDPAVRKRIVYKSVEGTATPVRDESGKKHNRHHTVKYISGKRKVVTTLQVVYGRELAQHKERNVLELCNSRGSYYYLIPVAE